MIAGTLEVQVTASTVQLVADMARAKQVTGSTMGELERLLGMTRKQIEDVEAAERQRASTFSRGLTESRNLLGLMRTAAQETAKTLQDIRLNPSAMIVPSEAFRSLETYREKIAWSIGAGSVIAVEKAKEAWDGVKGWLEKQATMVGIAVVAGVSVAAVSAVYAAYKATSFAAGLLSGDSYKSKQIDSLIALNDQVKTLQTNLPLTAIGASALNQALKAEGTTADKYVGTLHAVNAATRTNGDELDRLGVKYKAQNGELLGTNETLRNAAAVLATYREGWDRNQAAQAIAFGTEKEIQEAIAITAEKTNAAKDRLTEFHLVIGPGTQAAIEQYQKGMRAFETESNLTSAGFKAAIARNVMPVLTDLASFFESGMPNLVKVFDASMATITSILYAFKTTIFGVAEIIVGSLGAITSVLGGLGAAAVLAMKGDFTGAKDVLVAGWEDAQKRLKAIGGNIEAQARHNAEAIRLAWATDSVTAKIAPNATNPTGNTWLPKPDEVEELEKANAEYDRLLKSISERTAIMQGEISGTVKLTEAEQIAMKAMVGLRDHTLELTDAQKGELRVLLERMLAVDKDLVLRQRMLEANKALIESIEALIKKEEAFAAIISDIHRTQSQSQVDHKQSLSLIAMEVKALAELGPQYGELTKRTLEYNVARETAVQLARLDADERQQISKLNGEDIAFAEQSRQILKKFDDERDAVRDRVRQGLTAQADLNEFRRVIDAQQTLQVDMWKSIDSTAHDVWRSIYDGGKDTFTKLRDSLKNTLFALFEKLTLQPIMINLVTSVAGAGVAQQVYGAAATAGTGNSLLSLLSGGKSAFEAATNTSFLSTLFGGASSAALIAPAGAALTLGGGVTSLGAIGGASLVAPTAGGALLAPSLTLAGGAPVAAGSVAAGEAALSAATINSAAIGTGASALSTALPYIGLAIAAASMLGLFGSKKAPAVGTGYQYSGAYTVGGGVSGLESRGLYTAGGRSGYDLMANTDPSPAMLDKTIGKLVDEFAGMAKKLFGASLDGKSVGFDLTTSGIGQAQSDAAQVGIGIQIISKLAEELLPNIKDLALEGEQVIQTFARLSDEFTLVDKLLEIMGTDSLQAFGLVGSASLELRDKLVKLMGGLQNASTLTSAYYQNFYTQAEQHAADLKLVNSAMTELGLTALPKTRAEFRALVEAQDLATTAGQEMFAALLQLAPAFASVTASMEDAAAAADTLANRVAATQSAALASVSDQITAAKAQASAATQAAGAYRQITGSLVDAIARIRGNAGGAGAGLDALAATAMTGDAAALAKLPQAADAFLAGSLASSRTATDYARDQAKAIGILTQAAGVSGGMTNWNEYQATLLETQVSALEAIKTQLELPEPSIPVLNEQTAVLGTIAGLLREQTVQIVASGGQQLVLLQDQTGAITLGNSLSSAQLQAVIGSMATLDSIRSLTDAQLGALFGVQGLTGDQTRQIVTGNVAQDVIKNITAANATLSEQMLIALVDNTTSQVDQFADMIGGLHEAVSLLQQLILLSTQMTEAARIEEVARLAAAEAAATAAIAAARAQADASAARAAAEAAAAIETARVTRDAPVTPSLTFEQAQGMGYNYDQLLQMFGYGSIPGHAAGGLASGWSIVGERGPELVNFSDPGRVYTAEQTRAALGGGGAADVVAELRALRADNEALRQEIRSGLMTVARHGKKTADTLERVTRDGESMLTTTV